MKIRNITETTAGATSSGSVASVARPLGKMQERTQVSGLQPAEKIMKGKAKKKGPYGNSLVESEFTTKQQVIDYFVKRGKTPQQGAAAWERGWRGSKPKKTSAPKDDYMTRWEREKEEREDKMKDLSEAELAEADLIVVPGMRKMKDTSFIPHKADRRDHEVEMARSDLLAAAKNAMRMYKLLKDRTEDQGLMGWQQSYITLATDYLQSVADNLEYDARTDEMTGGVLVGGMSNFEEDQQRVDPLVTNALKRMEGPSVNDAVKALVVEIGTREFKSRLQHYKYYVNQMVNMYEKQGVAEGSLNEFAPDGFFGGGGEGGGKGPKAKAKAQMIKAYGPGIITFRKTSNGGYFIQHEDDFGDTNSHQYDPQTGKVDFSGVTRSSYYGEGVAEAEKPGLWANIHAKRERIKKGSGERMRKPGSKGAPTAQAFKQSQKTSKKK